MNESQFNSPDARPVFATKAEAFAALTLALKKQPPGEPFKAMPARVNKSELAEFLADALCETDPEPVAKIVELVQELKQVPSFHLLRLTNELEANGGRFLKGKGRRQTPGGIWFSLAKARLDRLTKKAKTRHEVKKPAKPTPKPATAQQKSGRVPEVVVIRRARP